MRRDREAASRARSTVAEAIKALENAGVHSWVQRVKRVWLRCPDLFGDADSVRVVPQWTSNAYHFNDPGGAGAASILNKKTASALSPKSRAAAAKGRRASSSIRVAGRQWAA